MYLQNASEKPATLGRALIISNTCNNTREGSEHDYHNIKQMLDKFGLITVGEHRNYSAQVGRLKPWCDVVIDHQLNLIINYNFKYIISVFFISMLPTKTAELLLPRAMRLAPKKGGD